MRALLERRAGKWKTNLNNINKLACNSIQFEVKLLMVPNKWIKKEEIFIQAIVCKCIHFI